MEAEAKGSKPASHLHCMFCNAYDNSLYTNQFLIMETTVLTRLQKSKERLEAQIARKIERQRAKEEIKRANERRAYLMKDMINFLSAELGVNIVGKTQTQEMASYRYAVCRHFRLKKFPVELMGNCINRHHASVLHGTSKANDYINQGDEKFLQYYNKVDELINKYYETMQVTNAAQGTADNGINN